MSGINSNKARMYVSMQQNKHTHTTGNEDDGILLSFRSLFLSLLSLSFSLPFLCFSPSPYSHLKIDCRDFIFFKCLVVDGLEGQEYLDPYSPAPLMSPSVEK